MGAKPLSLMPSGVGRQGQVQAEIKIEMSETAYRWMFDTVKAWHESLKTGMRLRIRPKSLLSS